MTVFPSKVATGSVPPVALYQALVIVLFCLMQIYSTEGNSSENDFTNKSSPTNSPTDATTNTPTVIESFDVGNEVRKDLSVSRETKTTTESTPPRIYLQKGNLKDAYLEVNNNESYKIYSNSQSGGRIQTSVQIYIIFFIGIMPAAIGAFVWWLQNLKNNCLCSSEKRNNSISQDVEKLSHSLMKNDKMPIDLVHQIALRAEKMSSGQNDIPYNSYRSRLIKSRRVYSLEVPRKCLEMIEILGEGNFGQVWKARSYQIGSKSRAMFVAVKTNKVNADINQQEDILKELDIMLQLGSHPNVVRLLGCCTENEPYYLVMEYISQGKLLSYLRHRRKDGAYYFEPDCDQTPVGVLIQNNNYMTYCNNNAYGYSEINHKTVSQPESLTPLDLIQFAYQISKGMEFISSHGIIHRDLAARNILIDENKNCKVADFGLSRSIRDKENDMYEMKHAGQMPIRWMSPETLSMGLFSTKSDVWAFGILLWEIGTLGSTPYIGMSASEVINYIRQGNICPQPEHCNDQLYDLMKSCWAYKTEDRFSFTDIKQHLTKMLLDIKEEKSNYIDLEHFNDSLYYFNTNGSPDEKL